MPRVTRRQLTKAILQCLQQAQTESRAASQKATRHKGNMLGTPHQAGAIEHFLGVRFDDDDRAQADRAFEDLKRANYIQPSYSDLADPEKWVYLTTLGADFLRRDLKDEIDFALEQISPHLVELRQGMHEAVERVSPDSARQAASSARELISQVLKAADPQLETRKARAKDLLRKLHPGQRVSKHDVAVIDAAAAYIEAEHDKLNQSVHQRGTPNIDTVRASVQAAERILGLLFKRAE